MRHRAFCCLSAAQLMPIPFSIHRYVLDGKCSDWTGHNIVLGCIALTVSFDMSLRDRASLKKKMFSCHLHDCTKFMRHGRLAHTVYLLSHDLGRGATSEKQIWRLLMYVAGGFTSTGVCFSGIWRPSQRYPFQHWNQPSSMAKRIFMKTSKLLLHRFARRRFVVAYFIWLCSEFT